MWRLIIFFIIGILIGIGVRKKQEIINFCSKLSEYTIYLLLFLLGILMGNSPYIKNILSMGIDAFILSVFSIVGSILAILPLTKRLK